MKAPPADVVALCNHLNPTDIPGRLSLICRMGAPNVATALPPIVKAVHDIMEGARGDGDRDGRRGLAVDEGDLLLAPEQAMKRIKKLEAEMYKHARNLEFEEAARLRDQIEKLRHHAFGVPGSRAG